MMRRMGWLGLPLLLAACAGAPTAPAPVEDRTAPAHVKKPHAVPPAAQKAKTRAYVEPPAVPQPLTVESLPPENGSGTPPTLPAASGQTEVPATAAAGPPLPRESNPAVVALVELSESKARAGQYESAAAALESAMRRDPQDPRLPHRMAGLKLRMKQYGQAETWASKSNALAAGDKALQARNWRIIEAARRALGDAKGAAKAAERARELGG